ncbi:MAG TPA: hypothetical protein DDZ40_01440 [Deltaproteobacteria bacterium]|nr:hypothetical protein [Deltaproteobacteria bacterium]
MSREGYNSKLLLSVPLLHAPSGSESRVSRVSFLSLQKTLKRGLRNSLQAVFPFLLGAGLFFLFVDILGESSHALAPARVIFVELHLFVEIGYAVIQELVRVFFRFYIEEGVPQLMAQYFYPVKVGNVVPAFLVQGDDIVIAVVDIHSVPGEMAKEVVRFDDPCEDYHPARFSLFKVKKDLYFCIYQFGKIL